MPKFRIKRWFSRDWVNISPDEVFLPDNPMSQGHMEALEERVGNLEKFQARLLAQLYKDRYITLEEALVVSGSHLLDEIEDEDPPQDEEPPEEEEADE